MIAPEKNDGGAKGRLCDVNRELESLYEKLEELKGRIARTESGPDKPIAAGSQKSEREDENISFGCLGRFFSVFFGVLFALIAFAIIGKQMGLWINVETESSAERRIRAEMEMVNRYQDSIKHD